MNAYEIVMESRQKLVEQVISNMKKDISLQKKSGMRRFWHHTIRYLMSVIRAETGYG